MLDLEGEGEEGGDVRWKGGGRRSGGGEGGVERGWKGIIWLGLR